MPRSLLRVAFRHGRRAFWLAVAAWIAATSPGASQAQPDVPIPKKAAAIQEAKAPGPEEVLALAISPEGKTLATAGARQKGNNKLSRLIIWDLASAKGIASREDVPGIRSLAFSPD